MKGDSLEQFIRENRNQFDTAVPNIATWSRIAEQLPQERPKAKVYNIKRFLSIAASVVLLISIGVFAGLQLADQNTPTLAKAAPELIEVEKFYTNKVNYKLAQLAKYPQASDSHLQKDLMELDEWLQHLHQDLIEVPAGQKEKVINAIIENYKIKLSLLETVLEHTSQEPVPAQSEDKLEKNISI